MQTWEKRKEELKEGKIFIYPPTSSSSEADIDHTSVVERRGWRRNPRAWQLNRGALLSSPHRRVAKREIGVQMGIG